MGRQKLQEIRHHFKVSENTTIFLRAKTECVEYTAVSELGLARLLEYNMSGFGLTLVLLRLNLDAATVALCRVRRSELRLEKDRHLYGGGSGQTITMVVHGEPELRAGRALLLAAVDHLEGRGERGDLADCAEQSLPSTPSQRIS